MSDAKDKVTLLLEEPLSKINQVKTTLSYKEIAIEDAMLQLTSTKDQLISKANFEVFI